MTIVKVPHAKNLENKSPAFQPQASAIVKRVPVVVIQEQRKISFVELSKLWRAELKLIIPEGTEALNIENVQEAIKAVRNIFCKATAAGKALGLEYQREILRLKRVLLSEEDTKQYQQMWIDKMSSRKLPLTDKIKSDILEPIYTSKRIIEYGRHGLLEFGSVGASQLRVARTKLEECLTELNDLLKRAPEQSAFDAYEKNREKIIKQLELKSVAEIPAALNWTLEDMRRTEHTILLMEQAPKEEQIGLEQLRNDYKRLAKELEENVARFKKNWAKFFGVAREEVKESKVVLGVGLTN